MTVNTRQPKSWDPNRTLLMSDLSSLNPIMCQPHLKLTKINQMGHPILLQIPYVPDCDLCPVAAMNKYTNVRPVSHEKYVPLFAHYDATPLIWYNLSGMLKRALSFA